MNSMFMTIQRSNTASSTVPSALLAISGWVNALSHSPAFCSRRCTDVGPTVVATRPSFQLAPPSPTFVRSRGVRIGAHPAWVRRAYSCRLHVVVFYTRMGTMTIAKPDIERVINEMVRLKRLIHRLGQRPTDA